MCFSALQRAENSSIAVGAARRRSFSMFQCSSASRKFLNHYPAQGRVRRHRLFQCSSASRKFLNTDRAGRGAAGAEFQCSSASRKFLNGTAPAAPGLLRDVSVLFSEPKIPQLFGGEVDAQTAEVSVLFSEPKIPQSGCAAWRRARATGFSALQRAENSSIRVALDIQAPPFAFQCSSASRKFLNRARGAVGNFGW